MTSADPRWLWLRLVLFLAIAATSLLSIFWTGPHAGRLAVNGVTVALLLAYFATYLLARRRRRP